MLSNSVPIKWFLQLGLILTHIIGLVYFLKGFFPSKVVLPGQNTFYSSKSPFGDGKPTTAQFDKVIVMMVDAMRSDFFYSEEMSQMSFLHNLINQGNAIPFTAFSNPPTVTLPRLKGITTGGTPSFLDAILNIADDKDTSQGLYNQDSWVQQFQSKGKIINFYGDDTWIKLFPTLFNNFEGTNSFYVSDFTEVDNNVTRHLDHELTSNNWDALILHYLGLDHIGHKGGPNSKFMKPKIEEMNQILTRLYEYIEKSKQKTLIVLLGDHGMNDIGNHGGSNIGEVSPGLTLISPSFAKLNLNNKSPLSHRSDYAYYDQIQQIDLVPTLSSLLNLPIPKNNLGIIVENVLPLWKPKQQKLVLWENCQQIMDLYVAKYGIVEQDEIVEIYESLKDSKASIEEYYGFLRKVQDIMATSSTNYNYDDIFRGYTMIVVSSIFILLCFNYYFIKISSASRSLVIFYEIFAVFYSLHFHGSSLIEEEHHIWWLLTTISVIFLVFYAPKTTHKKFYWFFGLFVLGIRFMKAWNNNGQKWSSKDKLGFYLLNENQEFLWILITITYFLLATSINFQGSFSKCFGFLNLGQAKPSDFHQIGSLISFILVFVGTSVSYSFKLLQYFNDGNEVPIIMKWLLGWILAGYEIPFTGSSIIDSELKLKLQGVIISLSRIAVYFMLAILFVRIVLGKLLKLKAGLITDITNIATLYLMHHTRQENIPMFLAFGLVKYSFTRILINFKLTQNVDQMILLTTLFTICLQNLSFFSMGNTNLLATVDLSNAYNGIQTYDVIPVGVLTFISCFVGPIYWSLSSLQILFEPTTTIYEKNSKDLTYANFLKQSIFLIKANTSLLFYAIAGVSLIGSCINLRFHLFIWTVFSPKLLYFASWSVLINFMVDMCIALMVLFVLY